MTNQERELLAKSILLAPYSVEDTWNGAGIPITRIEIAGGHPKRAELLQAHSYILNPPTVNPGEDEYRDGVTSDRLKTKASLGWSPDKRTSQDQNQDDD